MSRTLSLPPPADFSTFGPSQLFRYFFQIGRWTEEGFSEDFQAYTRGNLISTVTINKWKNKDVVPTRYSGALFRMIKEVFEPHAANDWIIAFETVWANHAARPALTDSGSIPATLSDIICDQHIAWIASQYAETLFGEIFSAADIYVPLQLIAVEDNQTNIVELEGLVSEISMSAKSKTLPSWSFICGGPGSGKSMAAIHLAQSFSKTDVFPIYLRGSHLSDIEIDIQNTDQSVIDSFSARSFLKHFRVSSRKSACLILDGLDEIPSAGGEATDSLSRFLNDLSREQEVCRAHGKELHFIGLGRQSHITFAQKRAPLTITRHLEMLGLDGTYHAQNGDIEALGEDHREVWWNKYLAANKWESDPTLPDFLCTEFSDFSEFGSEPLLTYLICRNALKTEKNSSSSLLPHEIVNNLTYKKNRNIIYGDIINQISMRASVSKEAPLKRNELSAVLQHIALANWHQGTGRTVSLETVQNTIQDTHIHAAFRKLSLGVLSSPAEIPEMLITAFYYRITKPDETASRETVIEFTHKSFSEYLTSTLILNHFEKLLAAFTAQQGFETALLNWTNISYAGEHTPALGDFCQNEASLRYESLSTLDWDAALEIIREHLSFANFKGKGLDSISQFQRSASLLFFIWSCLNSERRNRTELRFSAFENPDRFSLSDFKLIQPPNGLDFESGTLTEPRLKNQTFVTNSLSAINLASADLSQMSFSAGHMQYLSCSDSNFAMTHWSHVKISSSNFDRSTFQQAMFHGCRWEDSQLSDCLFQGTKFQLSIFSDCSLKNSSFSQCHFSEVEFRSTDLTGMVFDRCTFINCDFPFAKANETAGKASFRHCTFLDMEKKWKRISLHKLDHCIFDQLSAQ